MSSLFENISSKENRLIEIFETINIFLAPPLAIVSIILNAFCVFVFAKNLTRSKVYSYLTANSTLDIMIAIVVMPASILRYSKFSYCASNYLCNIYFLYFLFYLSRVIQMNSSFVNIAISIHRYKCMRNKNFNYGLRTLTSISVGILCVPFLIFLPNLFIFDITVLNFQDSKKNMNNTIYVIGHAEHSVNIIASMVIVNYIVNLVVFIVLCVINGLLICHLKKTWMAQANVQTSMVSAKPLIRHSYKKSDSTSTSVVESTNSNQQRKINYYKRHDNTETMIIISITFLQIYDQLTVILSSTLQLFPLLQYNVVAAKFSFMFIYISIPLVRCLNFFVYWKFSRMFKKHWKKC